MSDIPVHTAARQVADRAAARRRLVPDHRTAAQRLEAERRRQRRQAAAALDRELAAEFGDGRASYVGQYNPGAARLVAQRVDAERRFVDEMVARCRDIEDATGWADPTELWRRFCDSGAALRRLAGELRIEED